MYLELRTFVSVVLYEDIGGVVNGSDRYLFGQVERMSKERALGCRKVKRKEKRNEKKKEKIEGLSHRGCSHFPSYHSLCRHI